MNHTQSNNKLQLELVDIGNRIRAIRKEILNLSQEELAQILNTKQIIVSRMEKGRGSFQTFLDFVNYLNNNNYKGNALFNPVFDIEVIRNNIPLSVEHVVELLKLLVKETNKGIDDVIMRLEML